MRVICVHTIGFNHDHHPPGSEIDFPDGDELDGLLASGAVMDPKAGPVGRSQEPDLPPPRTPDMIRPPHGAAR